jgi:hypothetical protein
MGSVEEEKNEMTGIMEGPDMTGNIVKTRSVVQYKNGSRTMTSYAIGPDGKEMQTLKITYTRQK